MCSVHNMKSLPCLNTDHFSRCFCLRLNFIFSVVCVINTTKNYATSASFDIHVTNYNNPHQVDKTDVGLSAVDNTSDLDKPISTDTQSALDLKANSTDLVS